MTPEDQLEAVEQELAGEYRDLEFKLRAPLDHRVTDPVWHSESVERARARIASLEAAAEQMRADLELEEAIDR